MRTRAGILLIALLAAGCATTGATSMGSLQTRIAALERTLEQKEEQINDLQYDVKDLQFEIERLKARKAAAATAVSVPRSGVKRTSRAVRRAEKDLIRVSAEVRDVQRALKNAGYYDAAVDGKIGAKTKAAISRFQKAQGLEADGIVGRKTWAVLKTYLE